MPSLFPNSNAVRSSRKTRGESESRHQGAHRKDSSSKRSEKPGSRGRENKSPPPRNTFSSTAPYAQEKSTHEQLDTRSPVSRSASPQSRQPAEIKSSQSSTGSGGFFQLDTEPHTPAALQQYLETESGSGDDSLEDRPKEAQPTGPRLEKHSLPSTAMVPVMRQGSMVSDGDSGQEVGNTSAQDNAPMAARRLFTPPPAPGLGDAERFPVLHAPVPVYAHHQVQDPRAYYQSYMPNMYAHPPPQPLPGYRMDQPYENIRRHHDQPYSDQPRELNRDHRRLSMMTTTTEAISNYDSQDTTSHSAYQGAAAGRVSPEEEPLNLMRRIQTALPDLQLLLNRCEEVAGQNTVKQITESPAEDTYLEAQKRKDARIEELEKELLSANQKHVAERQRMRFEIGNLDELCKGLQEDLTTWKQSRRASTQDSNRQDSNVSYIKQLEEAKATQNQMMVVLKSEIADLSMEVEARLHSERSLQEKYDATIGLQSAERKVSAAQDQGERKELHDPHLQARCVELEALLKTRQVKIDELQDKDAHVHKAWAREKEDMLKSFEGEKAKLKQDTEKEARGATRRHEKAKDELERDLQAHFDDQMNEIETENFRLRKDYKRVKKDWHGEKERLADERGRLRAAASRLTVEHSALQKVIEGLGEASEKER